MIGTVLLSARCAGPRFASHLSFSQRLFSVGSHLYQEETKGKRKWTKEQLQPLITWNHETDGIYGPLIKKAKQASEKPNKKSAGRKSKNVAAKSEMAGSSVADQEVKRISKQKEFAEENVAQLVEHTKVFLKAPVFEDTTEYEEVLEPLVSESGEQFRKFDLTKSDVLTSNVFQPELDNQKLENLGDSLSEHAKLEDSVDVKENERTGLSLLDLNVNRDFLSTILSFPPFMISWNAPGGKLTIAGAAKSMTDLDPVVMNAGYPSVSAILKATMPPENKYFLDRWEKEMIEELGEEGFLKYKEELFANGTNLHLCIQQYLEGQKEIDLQELNQGHWQSFQQVFRHISDVACTEKSVRHSVLRYKGVLDCVANYQGKACIIDWKTSKKPKSDIRQTFDNPLQLAAYLGAYNSNPNFKTEVDNCLLVIGYQDGSPASVHHISRADCLRYWQAWQRRLHLYWSQYLSKNLSRAVG